MFEKFSQYLQDKAVFTIAELNRIEAVSQIVSIAKNEVLMQEGTPWIYNVFVCSGLMRSFIIDLYGNECTTGFAPENYWTGDRQSLLSGRPAQLSVDAIEDSHLLLIKQDDFHDLNKTVDVFNTVMSGVIQRNLIITKNAISENISFSEKEKYGNFLSKFEPVAHRIPHEMIASYVGTTPEILTRIQGSIQDKQT